jgi:hypothetical protein
METRLYNDIGGKCFNDPEYYLVAVITLNFQIDTNNIDNQLDATIMVY